MLGDNGCVQLISAIGLANGKGYFQVDILKGAFGSVELVYEKRLKTVCYKMRMVRKMF